MSIFNIFDSGRESRDPVMNALHDTWRIMSYISDDDLYMPTAMLHARAWLALDNDRHQLNRSGQSVGLSVDDRELIRRHEDIRRFMVDTPLSICLDRGHWRRLLNMKPKRITYRLVWDEAKHDLYYA